MRARISGRVFLALGANVGNREANLRLALRWLAPQCRVVAVSSLYRSTAVVPEGEAPGPDYVNAACEVETDLTPADLLAHIKDVEHAIGRRPAARWAPRPIDIDIALYGNEVVETADLRVPHPLLAERNFVLVPLAELAADVALPATGATIGELARRSGDEGLERVAGPEWADGG